LIVIVVRQMGAFVGIVGDLGGEAMVIVAAVRLFCDSYLVPRRLVMPRSFRFVVVLAFGWRWCGALLLLSLLGIVFLVTTSLFFVQRGNSFGSACVVLGVGPVSRLFGASPAAIGFGFRHG